MSKPQQSRSAEYAYEAIRAAILAGGLAPGSVVSQVRLAAELGVSRTPLREGLRRLEAEGLVTSDFNRRMVVSEVSLADLDELYAMRLTLEPLALRVSVPYLSVEEREAVRDALGQSVAALAEKDFDRFQVAHRRFHLGLTARCGDRLQRAVSDLWDQAERYRREYMTGAMHVGTLERTNDEHRLICDAAMLQDGDLAAEELTQHLLRTSLSIMRSTDGRAHPLAIMKAVPEAAHFDASLIGTHQSTVRDSATAAGAESGRRVDDASGERTQGDGQV
ncbi:GntR family transcriptional regulator [Ornithinimicrobium cavernae]|uniref:GntR family transcriptional regulator n=1 Tax=Ornithinimicrobium cavernae TaxID=2666047 RepID=UPI001379B89D|nr:GntR family transcriptional regulator [Ornithinimicrobium cavernae]